VVLNWFLKLHRWEIVRHGNDLLPLIVEEGCGLRPARKGGIKLEMEWAEAVRENGRIPVVHNYGWATPRVL